METEIDTKKNEKHDQNESNTNAANNNNNQQSPQMEVTSSNDNSATHPPTKKIKVLQIVDRDDAGEEVLTEVEKKQKAAKYVGLMNRFAAGVVPIMMDFDDIAHGVYFVIIYNCDICYKFYFVFIYIYISV